MYYITKFSEQEVEEILKVCLVSTPYCVFPLTNKRMYVNKMIWIIW